MIPVASICQILLLSLVNLAYINTHFFVCFVDFYLFASILLNRMNFQIRFFPLLGNLCLSISEYERHNAITWDKKARRFKEAWELHSWEVNRIVR